MECRKRGAAMKLNDLNLSNRFTLLLGGIVLMTALSARTFYTRQERSDLQLRLQEKAAFINKFYSFLIADALVRKDDITLLQVVNSLEEDQEISSVIVVDQRAAVRYHADPHKIGMLIDDTLIKNALQTGQPMMMSYTNGGGHALALICPLKVSSGSAPLGAVRIDLTYRRVEQQVAASQQRYWFIILGTLVTTAGLVIVCVNKWILLPLQSLRTALGAINTSLPEPNLPETADEMGETYRAVNDLIVRFKTEWQQQWSQQQNRGEQEKLWIHQLARSFMPDARLLIANKDNRVIADTGNGVPSKTIQRHLLDLIKDANFATLLTSAFQKEGDVVRGQVSFEDKTYLASVISVPVQQSQVVKTLIALQPY
jgi:hypothetical protein